MRISWPDGTSLEIGFTGVGVGKSRVALSHVKLSDKAATTRAKEFWTERFDALEGVLV